MRVLHSFDIRCKRACLQALEHDGNTAAMRHKPQEAAGAAFGPPASRWTWDMLMKARGQHCLQLLAATLNAVTQRSTAVLQDS